MKKTALPFIIIYLLSTTLFSQGEWSTLKTGAGGWLTGLDIHPTGNPIYARSDVGGAYRFNQNTGSWKQIVTSESIPAADVKWSNHQGVLSLVSAPSNSAKAYMAYNNTIYKSLDQGENWSRTNFPDIEMHPNDDSSKLSGERLAVDPTNEDIVYFGSINNGLYKTTDGQNWNKINSLPSGELDRGIRSIVFDTNGGSSNNGTDIVYITIDGAGVFKSTDAGMTWVNISTDLFTYNQPHFYDLEIDNNGNVYVVGIDNSAGGEIPFGAYRYDGAQWNQVFTDDLDIAFGEIAIDPFDVDRVLIFSYGYSDTYRTTNASATNPTWDYISMTRSAQNIPWMAWTETTWFTLGEIKFDPIIEDKIWVSWGTGTFYIIEDGSNNHTWIEESTGQEHLVSNDVISFSNGNKLTAHWDFPVFLHNPSNDYPTTHKPSSRFNSCWDLAQSPTDENFVVALIEDNRYCCWDDQTRNTSYSSDGGESWTKFASQPGDDFDLHFGQLAVSAEDNDNIIWLPGGNRSPFYTTDKGNSWTESTLPGQSDNCCIGPEYFKRKALTPDAVAPNTFYIYDWGAGHIFKTTDGGSSWIRYASVLPAWSFHGKITSVPGKEGHLLFSNGAEEALDLIEGVYHSTDGGASWNLLSNTDKVLNVTAGKAATPNSYPTIYICGEANGVYGYHMSTDQGNSWVSIGTYPLGLYDWPTVMEANHYVFGNLMIGFAGNGFIEYQEASVSIDADLTERIHIDQFGYKPNSKKYAIISDPQIGFNSSENYTPGATFQVIDAETDQSVFSGTPQEWNNGNAHTQSGDIGWQFDFTNLTTTGNYYIYDEENNTKSHEFTISESVYNDVLKAATKMFYYNRCNMEKAAPYADTKWLDANNFNNPLQDANCRFIEDPSNSALEKDLSGGWFDAGDYNKYVTFTHSTLHHLLYAFSENSDVFTDDWNIPESGNNIPDLLDEINWEMEWLEKMTNADGSVHIKMGNKNYSENISSPPSTNTDPRYYGPTCSSAAISVASVFAHAALVYDQVNGLENYGEQLKEKAITIFAYTLPLLESNTLDTDCDDGSIVAGDADWDVALQKENALIAAIHLLELTGDNLYADYIISHIGDASTIDAGWWGPYTNTLNETLLHYTTLPNADPGTVDRIVSSVTPHVEGDWDSFYGQNNLDLYRSYMPDWSYHWGSNMAKADYGNLNNIIANYGIDPASNLSHYQKAEEQLHYFHGVNPLGYTYISNMSAYGAENSIDEIYHTWFYDGTDFDNASTSLYGPAPGYLSGGANSSYTITTNSPPYGQPQQKSYLDFNTGFPDNSWEITEPAIYYQAAYIRLLANYTTASNTVPLTLLDFEVSKNNGDALLTWSTLNEINVNRFEIEVSTNGSDFSYLGEMVAIGNTNSISDYNYTDTDIDVTYSGNSNIYYRLKIVDLDGSFTYSPIRVISLSANDDLSKKIDLRLFPNPSIDRTTIEVEGNHKISNIKIFDFYGKEIMSTDINLSVYSMDLSSMPAANYIIKIKIGSTSYEKTLIKME